MGADNKRDAALYYAGLGYPVFPCVPNGKAPLTKRGFKDATTDQAQIETWWNQTPTANIGIATAGLIVIDVDGADNQWPNDADKSLSLMKAPMAITPRGGRHYVFRKPTGKEWRCTANELAKDVDTRTDGGYILVAPSCVENLYHWLEGNELECSPDKLPGAPGWLLTELDRVAAGKKSLDIPVQPLDANVIPSGQRNHTLFSLAGTMRRVGMGAPEILAALTQANNLRCQPPLPASEVERIVTSSSRYEPDQIAVAVTENHWGQDQDAEGEEETTLPWLDDPGTIPNELLRVPGFVNDVMQHCLATAPRPNRVLAFAGALALQGHLAGRKIRDPYNNRTNLYVIALGNSGIGKDRPRELNGEIIIQAGGQQSLGDSFSSGEGLEDSLKRSPAMFYQTDEIETLMRSMAQRKDGGHEMTMKMILQLFSRAKAIHSTRTKAGNEEAPIIMNPHLTIFGTAISKLYYASLTERFMINGLFPRLIVFEAGKRGKKNRGVVKEIPEGIVETAKGWIDLNPGGGNLNPIPHLVPHTTEASRVFEEAEEEFDRHYDEAKEVNDEVGMAVWGRTCEHALKLALVYAASEAYGNLDEMEISADAARWATQFMLFQEKQMIYTAQRYSATSEHQEKCKRVLEIVRSKPGGKDGGKWPTAREIKRKINDLETKVVDNLLADMAGRGEIVPIEAKRGVHRVEVYRLPRKSV